MKKITFLIGATVGAFLACTGSPESKNPYKPTEESTVKTRETILKEIEDTWRELGYSEKPVKYLALTYDDGPSQYSEQLLDILAEKKVRAAFFLIGNNIGSRQAVVRRMRDEGHEIANHSRSHKPLGNAPREDCETEIQDCTDAIFNATNADGKPVRPAFFRPPNLSKGGGLYAACEKMGFPIIEGALSGDYNGGSNAASARDQANAIIVGARNWLIALNHDPQSGNPDNILAAVPLMIDGLRADGYYLLTVGELLIMRGCGLTPGKVYNDFENVP